MAQRLKQMALVVRDYDEALAFYVGKLRFELVEDTVLSETKRWVLVRPPGGAGAAILLARAVGAAQESRIGNQTGGRVFLFLETDQFDTDYQHLLDQEVKIIRTPVVEPYGKVAVFEDIYGNWWDLIGIDPA